MRKGIRLERDTLTTFLDSYLRVNEIEDSSQNGLQIEGPKEVTRIAFAVDGCLASFEQAVAADAQLLIVHHGLFWSQPIRLVGPLFQRVRTLVKGGCGLYAVHLPLDLHPEIGNNAELTRILALQDTHPFGEYHGIKIGIGGTCNPSISLDALVERLIQATGEPPLRILDHGPKRVSRVACISGGAASLISQAADAGFDTFVTGETSHSSFHDAAEYGLNVVFGGHYATETLGLEALERQLAERFDLETLFLDLATGM
jgi:dinuclear metal center YbgI/SA1388 family protein